RVLIGDAVNSSLAGTTDNTFYTHYSQISTIEANWGLPHLGRGDVNPMMSNVFELVVNKTGYKNVVVADSDIPYYNQSEPGILNPKAYAPIPTPNNTAPGAGGVGLLSSIASLYNLTTSGS